MDAPEQDVIVEPKEAPRDPSIRDVLAELEEMKRMLQEIINEQGCRYDDRDY